MNNLANKRQRLPDKDRAELCSRVDFLAVLEADGIEAKKNGRSYLAKMRDEKTASCNIYPPGVGKKGAQGWTYHDYGETSISGDALAYIMDTDHGHGLAYPDAVREMARLAGWWPEGWKPKDGATTATSKRKAPAPYKAKETKAAPLVSEAVQSYAACALLADLECLDAKAATNGAAYLQGRGCLPPGAWSPSNVRGFPVAWELSPDAATKVEQSLAKDQRRGDIEAGGVLTERGSIVGWVEDSEAAKWERVPLMLMPCHTPEAQPVYIVGRQTDYRKGRGGKYLNQRTSAAQAKSYPWGLPGIYRHPRWFQPAPEKKAELLIVEGIVDALAAIGMGWPAMATLTHPGAGDPDDRNSAAHTMFTAHLPALRTFSLVRVLPDADEGELGEKGEAKAAKLVGWLRARSINAEAATLAEIVPDIPEGCEDLGDIAAAMSRQ